MGFIERLRRSPLCGLGPDPFVPARRNATGLRVANAPDHLLRMHPTMTRHVGSWSETTATYPIPAATNERIRHTRRGCLKERG